MKAVGEAYGDREDMVLMAIKTDGGGVSNAKDYVSKRTDVNKWLVVVDNGGKYYEKVMGKKGLWRYSVVDHEGKTTVNDGDAGIYHGKIKEAKLTAGIIYKKKLEEAANSEYVSFLPKGKKYKASLAPILKGIKCGKVTEAMKLSSKLPKADKEAYKILLVDINEAITKQVEVYKTHITETEDANRIVSYTLLEKVSKMKKIVAAKTAKDLIKEIKKAKTMAAEVKARDAYNKMMRALKKGKNGKPSSSKYKQSKYKAFLRTHGESYYGSIIKPLISK